MAISNFDDRWVWALGLDFFFKIPQNFAEEKFGPFSGGGILPSDPRGYLFKVQTSSKTGFFRFKNRISGSKTEKIEYLINFEEIFFRIFAFFSDF